MEVFDIEPVFASARFLLRPVEESDAADLLRCYSDEETVERMNADNCTGTFLLKTTEEMKKFSLIILLTLSRKPLLSEFALQV